MTHFPYSNGRMHAEGVALDRIAAEIGTPFYCYSSAVLTERYRMFERAVGRLDARVCYALKANSNQAMVVGAVLVFAVYIDTIYRKHAK